MEFGSIGPGESKEVEIQCPPSAKPGDRAILELNWTCGRCGKEWTRKFEIILGQTPSIKFGCNCGDKWNLTHLYGILAGIAFWLIVWFFFFK